MGQINQTMVLSQWFLGVPLIKIQTSYPPAQCDVPTCLCTCLLLVKHVPTAQACILLLQAQSVSFQPLQLEFPLLPSLSTAVLGSNIGSEGSFSLSYQSYFITFGTYRIWKCSGLKFDDFCMCLPQASPLEGQVHRYTHASCSCSAPMPRLRVGTQSICAGQKRENAS